MIEFGNEALRVMKQTIFATMQEAKIKYLQ